MKDNAFEDFEDYLQNKLEKAEIDAFNKRLEEDTSFAASFSVYKEIEEQMRLKSANESKEEELVSTLNKLNRKYITEESTTAGKPVVTRYIFKWASGIAAGIGLYFVASALFFGDGPDAQQMANEYFAENLTTLEKTMSGSSDSLQLGIAAYEAEKFQLAQVIFEDVLQRDSLNSEAERNLGLTHLAQEEFDQALNYFEKLASKDLQYNEGKFFQAMVLLKRGNPEDFYLAEILLNEVVNLHLARKKEAKRWLEAF